MREWFTGQGKSSNEIALEQFAESLALAISVGLRFAMALALGFRVIRVNRVIGVIRVIRVVGVIRV